MIRLSRPDINTDDEGAVLAALRSGWLTGGQQTREFERELAAFVGVADAVCVSSGTAALLLALHVAGVGQGDEVLVPAFTYPATAHAVRLVGATPVFVDVDDKSWNMSISALELALDADTKAVIPVDQFGLPIDLNRVKSALREAGSQATIIQDAACALGSRRADAACGQGVQMACFSFHPRKIMTTAEGGAIVSDDVASTDQLRMLRNHGRDDQGRFQIAAGNYRMSELSASLGRSQLARLEQMIQRRRAIVARYQSNLASDARCTFQMVPDGYIHNYQTFAVCLADEYPRDDVIARLKAQKIETGPGTSCVPREMPYKELTKRQAFPVAEKLTRQTLALPLYSRIEDQEVDYVCEQLHHALS